MNSNATTEESYHFNIVTTMVLEMISEEPDSGEKTTMRVTDIQENADVTYTMSDYPVFGFGE